ncbi:hypothetical protein IAU60_004522 [Kwoniella sp. DSM 27419]
MSHAPHPLATPEQIVQTPSARDGLPGGTEADLRVAGCMLIQEAGVMMSLPQSTLATAQVLFHRFYYVSSFRSFSVYDISISCLFLSTKLCETPVRLRDLINTYLFLIARIDHLLSFPPFTTFTISHASTSGGWQLGDGQREGSGLSRGKAREQDPVWRDFKFDVPGFHDEVFWEWKDAITAAEMQILKRLGFNMQVDLPYSHMINYLKILDLVFEDDVAQRCWSILNDMLLTPAYAIHPPHTLACASILLATRQLRIPLPDGWHILFDAEWDDIWSCCGHVMSVWSRWAPDPPGKSARDDTQHHGGLSMRKDVRWTATWVTAKSRHEVRRHLERGNE